MNSGESSRGETLADLATGKSSASTRGERFARPPGADLRSDADNRAGLARSDRDAPEAGAAFFPGAGIRPSRLALAVLIGLLMALLIGLLSARPARAEYARVLITAVDREARSVVVEATGASDLPTQSAPEAHRQAALADAKRKALAAARTFLETETREKRLTAPYRFVRVEGLSDEEAVFVLESRERPANGTGGGKVAVTVKAEVVYVVKRDGQAPAAVSGARPPRKAASEQPASAQPTTGKPAEPPQLPLAKPGRSMDQPASKPNDFKKNLEEMTDAILKRMDGGGN